MLLLLLCRRVPLFLSLLASNLLSFQKKKIKKQRGQKLIIRVKEYECSLCYTFNFSTDLEFYEVKENIKKNSVSLNNCDFFFRSSGYFLLQEIFKKICKIKNCQVL